MDKLLKMTYYCSSSCCGFDSPYCPGWSLLKSKRQAYQFEKPGAIVCPGSMYRGKWRVEWQAYFLHVNMLDLLPMNDSGRKVTRF